MEAQTVERESDTGAIEAEGARRQVTHVSVGDELGVASDLRDHNGCSVHVLQTAVLVVRHHEEVRGREHNV